MSTLFIKTIGKGAGCSGPENKLNIEWKRVIVNKIAKQGSMKARMENCEDGYSGSFE